MAEYEMSEEDCALENVTFVLRGDEAHTDLCEISMKPDAKYFGRGSFFGVSAPRLAAGALLYMTDKAESSETSPR